MAFTRDDLIAYEKANPAPQAEVAETPPEEVVQASTEDPSTPVEAVQAEPVKDGSSKDATAESSTAPAETDSETQTEEASDGKPARGSARERIEELVTERNALRKYGEYLLDQVKAVRNGQQPQSFAEATKKEEPKPVNADDPAPTIEQHNFDPVAYSKAQAEWMDRQINKRVASAIQGIETRQTEQSIRQSFENRAAEFRKAQPDFDVVIANPALPALNADTARNIVRSELGPQIAYHLAKNPDMAARIAKMDNASQLMAIGRLEATLQQADQAAKAAQAKPSVPKTRTVTQAPPPPKPVATGKAVVETEPMNMDEWVAQERAREIAAKEEKKRLRLLLRRY